jgi:hypothetical protein
MAAAEKNGFKKTLFDDLTKNKFRYFIYFSLIYDS